MRKRRVLWYVVFGLMFMCAVFAIYATRWYGETYTVRFKELLYTLLGPLEGFGNSVRNLLISNLMPPLLAMMALYISVVFLLSEHPLNVRLWQRLRHGKRFPARLLHKLRRAGAIGCIVLLLAAVDYVNSEMAIAEFIASQSEETTIYEDEYVDPAAVAIAAPAKKRNLICVVAESLETSYMSEAEGGFQPVNLMPELTGLLSEGVSFSGLDTRSGWNYLLPTSWTMASLLATSSGIPFAFPVDGNDMSGAQAFAPNLTTLGDILKNEGYRQEFLCGSDAAFGGRKLYYQSHGDFDIYDLFTARENGVIPEDYYEWWGFEDRILFDIARDEATRLASGGEPFNLTLLTVDLHHLNGYVCPECGDAYDDPTANVVACTDRQIAAFVRWCQQQPFYENTTILVMGDHPRMDTALVELAPMEQRTVYHCLFNSAVSPEEGATTSRSFTAMDLFPTTLAALGFTIDGERLGLGTNLFSGQPTLAERLGIETLGTELDKNSSFYIEHFCQGLSEL